ncbi:MAG: hypothetical protein HQL32_14545, partial [Planctomycetes bacterium]|nr:hypothetical protein [Planctomycetota bacterium]
LIDNAYPNNNNKPYVSRGNKELYNLEKDPMEEKNLYRQYPEISQELEDLLEQAIAKPRTRLLTD